jgi:phosphatidylethanolamine/phosphatidyl-N-methylethanolamine N-methyltransferase
MSFYASCQGAPSTRGHAGRFLRSWLADPLRVGAVAPSGRALSRLITGEIGAETGPVLELGPGTGVFTQALIDRGVRQADLTLVEYGVEFAEILRRRFPAARTVCMDAAQLSRRRLFVGQPVGAVVSGMPMLSMPIPKVMRILAGVAACLRPAGALYQFTYGPRCPIPDIVLDRFGLRATRLGRTLRNLPPAAVYRIAR